MKRCRDEMGTCLEYICIAKAEDRARVEMIGMLENEERRNR